MGDNQGYNIDYAPAALSDTAGNVAGKPITKTQTMTVTHHL
ncbi:MAG: hypothetical protein ACREH8_18085 [Opitutaceae bacterium]